MPSNHLTVLVHRDGSVPRLVRLLVLGARALFWALLFAIVLFSVVPPSGRPATGVPHAFEHAGIFLLLGFVFAAGYRLRVGAVLALIGFTAAVEVVQFAVPGRHPRGSDFIENIVGLAVGIGLICLLNWVLTRVRINHSPRASDPGR